MRDAEALTGAARRLFGSWGAAIEAAGLDYQEIKNQARLGERFPSGYWDTQIIIKKIRTREASGLSLNPHAIQKENSKLYAAAASYFGSWGKAIEAAGIDYLEHRKTRAWDTETVIQQIKVAHARGADMSDTTAQALAGGLYGAAITHFGSWLAAVEAAGMEYKAIRRTQQWSKEEILNTIQCAVADGRRFVRTSFPPNFYPSVVDYFGSWKNLLDVAGYGETP